VSSNRQTTPFEEELISLLSWVQEEAAASRTKTRKSYLALNLD
jgi:hypothetical protein